MTKKYYIWEDPACGGVDIAWKEVTGREFYALMKLPKNRGRKFVRLGNDICPDADIITLEATEEDHAKWRREQNEADYLARQEKGKSTISLDVLSHGSGLSSLYEALADGRIDVERAALSHLAHETLTAALTSLRKEEVAFLAEIYAQRKSAVQMAKERGVSQPAITQRRDRLLKRLKKFF